MTRLDCAWPGRGTDGRPRDTKGTSGTSSYGEDQSGNLTTLPTGASASYNDASELVSSTLAGTATTYAYDASGNLTGQSVGGTQTDFMSYNGANELTYVLNSSATMNYAAYDGNGLRMSSSITPSGGSADIDHNVWSTTGSVPKLLMDSSNAYAYGTSGTPFEQVDLSTGAVTFLVSDALGSARGAVSSAGGLEATANYDAWGNVEGSSTLSSYTSIGFDGVATDESGLIYFVHRNYDPVVGQFSTVDPLVMVTGQEYAFTNDNPVNGTDNLGTEIDPLRGGGGGFVGTSSLSDGTLGSGDGVRFPEDAGSLTTSPVINDALRGAKYLGEKNGIKYVQVPADDEVVSRAVEMLKEGSTQSIPKTLDTGYKYHLPDGSSFVIRASSRWGGATLDIQSYDFYTGKPVTISMHLPRGGG